MKLGNSPKSKGFHYLCVGLKFIMSDPRSVTNLSKILYPKIAEKFQATAIGVERSVRSSIQTGWHRRDIELAKEMFGNTLQSDNDIPSNALYISAVAEWLKWDSDDDQSTNSG
ncbi:MAG: sporulation initiation factor Spo0A C-terminal domain-containing protein [Ruminococcus sp.]|nr:sporulation initiation factor Spo0A C-terminal domain-containing protein [Ruminococcus sp.]